MTERRPLVIVGGQVQELPVGDTTVGASVTGSTLYAEPVVVAGFNLDVVYAENDPTVPLFVTTTDGDIVSSGV